MMRNSTSAMPSEGIQLSNHRARVERRRSWGAKGTGAGCAPEPSLRAPNSCMAFTLAKVPARSNSHGPPASPPPAPHPVPELVRQVAMAQSGGDTGRAPFPLDANPDHARVGELVERPAVERRAAGCEDDHQRFVTH